MGIRNWWLRTVARGAIYLFVFVFVLNVLTDAALFAAPGQILRLNQQGFFPLLGGNDALVELLHDSVVRDPFGLSCSDKFVIVYQGFVLGAMHEYQLGQLKDFNLVRIYFSDIVGSPERRSLSQERILEINRIMIERCRNFDLPAYESAVQDR